MTSTDLAAEHESVSDERILLRTRKATAGKKKRRLRFREGIFNSIWARIKTRIARAVLRPVMLLREFGLPLFLLALTGALGWGWTVYRDNRAEKAKVYETFAYLIGESVRGTPKEVINQPYLRTNVVVFEQHTDGYSICKDYTPPVLDPKDVGTAIRVRWIETKEWLKDAQGNPLGIRIAGMSGGGVMMTTVHAELDLIDMARMRVIASKVLRPQSPAFEEGDDILTHPPYVTIARGLVVQQVDEWLSLPIKKE